MTRALACLAVVLAGCGAPPSVPTAHVATPPAHASLEDLSTGTCGGFAELGEGDPIPLLAGRLAIRAPEGAADSPRPTDIMAAPPTAELESRLFLQHGDARFVVFAVELFRTPTDDLVQAVRDEAGDAMRVAPLDVRAPLRAAIAIPEALDFSGEGVNVAKAYTVTEDGLVQQVGFYVTPDAARSGGCERLALHLAGTLIAGARTLPDRPGPTVLEGTLGLDLPADHRVVVEEGPDFVVYRVLPVLPLGDGEGGLGIYLGGYPSFRAPDEAARVPGRLLGGEIEWREWSQDELTRRETLAQAGNGYAHVFAYADDRSRLDRLTEIASSLRTGVRAPPLAACPSASELPAVEVEAEVLAIPALQALLHADRFSIYRRTWDVAQVEPTEAFAALMAHPRARDALLYLAVHGTTAGRLYGLAGLYFADRARFEDIVCAVRDAMEPSVVVQRACGTETVPVAPLIESPDAVRGQAHWPASEWHAALADAPADLRGGGLPWTLILGAPDERAIESASWTLSGTGYSPPIDPGDHAADAMPPFAPARAHPTAMAMTQAGGICRTRRDGRVACWGVTPASEQRGASLLPASVRWPSALAVDLGLGCVLDASGRRACFGLLEPALNQRHAACTSAPLPSGPVVRRFDDGPWRALGVAGDVCGIRADGTLHCFASTNRYLPEWATLEGTGIGTSYAVPIEGEVRGMAEGYLGGGYAWTADGTIWSWDQDTRPTASGPIEGVADVTGGNDGDWAFARTADGRVFVRGARHGQDGSLVWWSSSPRDGASWEEVPALRGARVVLGDHHGCALTPDGRVSCWGQRTGFAPGDAGSDYERPPEDVPALRGAETLLVGEWLTCGAMRGGALRCIGEHLESVGNHPDHPDADDAHGPIDVRPDRIAESVR